MALTFTDPIVAGVVLVRPAIQSPNYVAGVSGWAVKIDGSAEFNNLTIRGQFFGVDFIINSAGIFFYSGVPAAGNLIVSIAPAAGVDGFTNPYIKGLGLGNASGIQVLLKIISGVQAAMQFPTNNANESIAANMTANVIGAGAAQFLQLVLSGPKLNVVGAQDWVQILFDSANAGNTSTANMFFNYIGSGGGVHGYAVLDATGFNILAGSIVAAHPGAVPLIPETWQTLALVNAFTSGVNPGGFLDVPQIRLRADNVALELKGTLTVPGVVTSKVFSSVPAGYPNANLGGNYGLGLVANFTGAVVDHVQVQNNGNLSLHNANPGSSFDLSCCLQTQ